MNCSAHRILVILIITSLSQLVEAQQEDGKQWRTIMCTGEPIARHEAGFIGVENNFYLLGGRRIQPVSIYNSDTKTWSQGKEPPLELHHFQGFAYDGDVYVAGAFTGKYPYETPVTDIYKYDVENDIWTTLFTMPKDRARGAGGAVVHDHKLYMVGGLTNGHWDGHVKWFDVYDLKTGEWTVLPDMPRFRDHFNAVIVKERLYLIGGRMSSAKTEEVFELTEDSIDVYDFKTSKWTTLESKLPTQRAGNAAIAVQNEILVVGGESNSQTKAHAEVEAFNVLKGEWKTYPSLLDGRHGTQLIYHKGALYIASGCGNRGGSPELTSLESFSLE